MSVTGPGTTQLRVARLTKAHGLKGAIKLELYTDEPDKRFTPGSTFTLQVPRTSEWHGKKLELVELRWYNSHPVAFFRGVDDRNAAETLLKAILWIDEEVQTQPGEDDSWYDYQLVGMKVVRDGVEVGTVRRVDHFPAQDLLIVGTPSGEVMVPFVNAIVPSVDAAAGIVTVTPPIGLFEEAPEEEPAAVDLSGVDLADPALSAPADADATDASDDADSADADAALEEPADDEPPAASEEEPRS
ncbi:ribosome maturation factor RimM [Rathayibacter sp. AY1G1]|uniref:ribosome maturation factor RimM n=1 Tax=unclassified Rathayibacter TaxID=2609250 RepID=UPI000CE85987|nr:MULTISPECIES: ribosome maturation factor RimM [unclassified Rathayibacter]PPH08474.1 ribosome maturation factor RimM [Rathayibacter sp. AY1H3]PPH11178.1 ribosome maturation factor RimM [Rathayibacter sp. AY1G1]PPH17413.1 ribosome maturation factor RimM [Rathayibacter sp. AY1F8]PPH74668.1 ribosome maturation factor RimM [Rathayibacter sp. AY1D4]PPH91631.1 ribosome maturation factor RimM [Rathayibacter sp. AY1D3]